MQNTERQSPFKREVSRAEKQAKAVMVSLTLLKQSLEKDNVGEALDSAVDFAYEAERLTLLARELVAYTGHPQANKLINQVISDSIPIRIGFTNEGWFGVVIPALLPKKQKGSVDFIREPLYIAMKDFFKGKNPVRYTDCFLIYRHVYRRDRPERRYRDHDNIEVNAVTDIIALYVLFDDSPLCCSHLYCSAAGDENRTEVYVVPQFELSAWFSAMKSNGSKGVILHENILKTSKKHT